MFRLLLPHLRAADPYWTRDTLFGLTIGFVLCALTACAPAPCGDSFEVNIYGTADPEEGTVSEDDCFEVIPGTDPPEADYSACCPEGYFVAGRGSSAVTVVCVAECKS